MYAPKHFQIEEPDALWALMREFNFALLVTAAEGLPCATSIPFSVDAQNQKLSGHLAKPNPQCEQLLQLEHNAGSALVVFQAEHAFVSSRWYQAEQSVPTWNYATVHARVRPRALNGSETRAQLMALMRDHGHEKPMQALNEDYLAKMQNGILGFEFEVQKLEGSFKLSQNKSQVDQQNVIAQLEQQGELERGIAKKMRQNLEQDKA